MPPPLPRKELGHTLGAKPANVSLAAYLDYVCPFSAKAYRTLVKQVVPHYKGKSFNFVFHHQVQPWHPQSTWTHEAGLAVAKVGGEEAFWKFSDALFDKQTDFFDWNVVDKTRGQVMDDLAALAEQSTGTSKEAVLELLALQKIEAGLNPGSEITNELKFAVKMARHMGIHVSPTTTINGIIVDTSSSWTLEQWRELLDPLLE